MKKPRHMSREEYKERKWKHKNYPVQMKPRVAPVVPGRNEPCLCGSRIKYKNCCLRRAQNEANQSVSELIKTLHTFAGDEQSDG